MKDEDWFVVYSQYYGCWLWSQGISSQGIDIFLMNIQVSPQEKKG